MQIVVIILKVFMWVFIAYKVIQNIERAYCVFVRGQILFVPSGRVLRRELVREILIHYPNAKTIVEIGAGYGGLARKIARAIDANVYAIENMPLAFFILRGLNLLTRTHNCVAIRADAFKYLSCARKKFDVGVAYLGPAPNQELKKIANKFDVIITLDAPIIGWRAIRTIDLSRYGFTRWGNMLFPHMLFVYNCRRRHIK